MGRSGDGKRNILWGWPNGFNKMVRTGNLIRFNKVVIFILPSKQQKEILFEATTTCAWLKLVVCSICLRFATQQRHKWYNKSSG